MTHAHRIANQLSGFVCAIALSGCSVFEPPPDGTLSSGGRGSGGIGTGGTDSGLDASNGGTRPVDSGAGGSSVDAGSGGIDGQSPGTGGGGGNSTGGSGGAPADSGADGAAATGPWWITENEHGCEVISTPKSSDRPAQSDPGESLEPIYLAMSRFRVGNANDDETLTPDANAFKKIGLDMDGVCTNSATCEIDERLVRDFACKTSAATPIDGDQCRDNAVGNVFVVASNSPTVSLFGVNERDWNCELHRGGFSLIFKISNYNGQKNDRDVRVDLYTSIGLQVLPGWACREGGTMSGALDPRWPERATWLSTEHWKIAQQDIDLSSPVVGDELRNSVTADPAAYVRNGYLFARFPDGAKVWLHGQRTPVPGFRSIVYRSTLIGPLTRQQDDTWQLEKATLAYVQRPDLMLRAFREIGYCENMCSNFDVLTGYLNNYVDSLFGTSEILPEVQCDGLSYGSEIDARQATATMQDVEPVEEPTICPTPRHPDAPPHGCICNNTLGTCTLPGDGGS